MTTYGWRIENHPSAPLAHPLSTRALLFCGNLSTHSAGGVLADDVVHGADLLLSSERE